MQVGGRAYELIFPEDYHGQWEEECRYKGWLSGVQVRLGQAEVYAITFVDKHRLAQMFDDQIAAGLNYLAEPALLIVAEVTRKNMEAAVEGLIKDHYFESLRPSALP